MALVPVVLIGFMGAAGDDLFWPFEMSLELPVLCGLAILLLFDHRPRFADPLACLLTTIAVFSSGVGLVVLAGAMVEVSARRDRLRRAWIAVVPLVLYAAWWLGYHATTHTVDHVPYVPGYDVNAAAAAAGAIVGLDMDWGRCWPSGCSRPSSRLHAPSRLPDAADDVVRHVGGLLDVDRPAARRDLAVPNAEPLPVRRRSACDATRARAARRSRPGPVTCGVLAIAGVLTLAVALSGLQQLRALAPPLRPEHTSAPELTAVEMARATLPPDTSSIRPSYRRDG